MTYFAVLYSGQEFAENAKTALLDSLLGMAVVFSSLIILWLVIEVFRLVFEKVGSAGKKKEKSADAPVAVDAPETAAEVAECGDEIEIVAAITAAISVYLDVPQTSFRVVSFRKNDANTNWNKGR